MTNNFSHISALKVLGLILVVLGHSLGVYNVLWVYSSIVKAPLFHLLDLYISSFHIKLFLFVSGYLYCYGKLNKKQYKKNKDFFINKAKRLLIPYFFIALIYMVPIQLWIKYGPYQNQSLLDIVFKGIILGKFPDHLWYVMMIFNVFVIFKLLLEKLTSKYSMVSILAVLFLLNLTSMKVIPDFFQLPTTFKNLIYFYIGYIVFANQDKLKRFITKKYAFAFFTAHLFVWSINTYFRSTSYVKMAKLKPIFVTNDFIMGVLGIFFCYIFIYLYFQNNNDPNINKNYIYRYLNQYNFSIYLLHEPIIFIILSKYAPTLINPIILVSLCFFGSILISILLSKIIERIKIIRPVIGL